MGQDFLDILYTHNLFTDFTCKIRYICILLPPQCCTYFLSGVMGRATTLTKGGKGWGNEVIIEDDNVKLIFPRGKLNLLIRLKFSEKERSQ